MTDAALDSAGPSQGRKANPAETTGPMLAADGTPLKRSLARALRRQKLRALALIAPLLIFILVTFIAPIADMLFRSVENQIVAETLPRTVQAVEAWDYESGEAPAEEAYRALLFDMVVAVERKLHTRLGTRLNYETTGISSLFRKTGRGVDDIGEDHMDAFAAVDARWEDPAVWAGLMGAPDWLAAQADWAAADPANRGPEPAFALAPGIADALPATAPLYADFAAFVQSENDSPVEEDPWAPLYVALHTDLVADPEAAARLAGSNADLVTAAAAAAPGFEVDSVKAAFLDIDEDWGDAEVWGTIKAFAPAYTPGYFLSAVDLQKTPAGVTQQPENQQIYIMLFERTLFMSLMIMGSCILLGYPIAYLLATLPLRVSNVLLILVLLPFWTSLLVRTSAWKVLLQQQGVINDILVWLGLVNDAERLVMINNQFGTIVAMTHILLPFMILPLYSVMKTIPPTYVRAAKSLGATNWTAFWRVYFPQSVPGIGAGCILVFILAIGYYITPELVGGTTGTFISNRIAYHISSLLNWGLAAALGTILLAVVLLLYWLYDRIVGIDNVSLG